MAIVTVSSTDTGGETLRWEVPQDIVLNQSPIPRGIREYGGAVPIAALGAGDETSVVITLTFPSAFNYVPKSLTMQFQSDDLTSEFSNLGVLEYRVNGVGTLGVRKDYQMFCNAPAFRFAATSNQIYVPQGTWRQWVNGPDGDFIVMLLADISGDASTAGDVSWTAEFWEYDIEQCLKWPVNTPQPMLPY